MKLILEKRGKDYDTRVRRNIKNSLTAMGGSTYRVNYRERAKEIVHDFLSQNFEQDYMFSKVRKTYQYIVWIQRMFRTKLKVSQDTFVKEAHLNEKLVAKGLQAFLIALLVHSTKKQKKAILLFDKTFEKMQTFREQLQDDHERLSAEAKELREQEVCDLKE